MSNSKNPADIDVSEVFGSFQRAMGGLLLKQGKSEALKSAFEQR